MGPCILVPRHQSFGRIWCVQFHIPLIREGNSSETKFGNLYTKLHGVICDKSLILIWTSVRNPKIPLGYFFVILFINTMFAKNSSMRLVLVPTPFSLSFFGVLYSSSFPSPVHFTRMGKRIPPKHYEYFINSRFQFTVIITNMIRKYVAFSSDTAWQNN